MRIISGKNKGKQLVAPNKLPVRPTTDFAKEALFNILNNYYYFEELSVLDLFAGTGNISYEFASRGCPSVLSVDNHNGCVQFINKISRELVYPITALKADVFEDLKGIADIVFNQNLLTENGMLIIEHSSKTDLSEQPFFSQAKKYGGSVFSFFEKEEQD